MRVEGKSRLTVSGSDGLARRCPKGEGMVPVVPRWVERLEVATQSHTHTSSSKSSPVRTWPATVELHGLDASTPCLLLPSFPLTLPAFAPKSPLQRALAFQHAGVEKNKTKRNQTPGRWPARRFILPQRQHRFVFAEAGSQLPHPANFLEGRVQPGRMDNVTQPDFVT